MRRYLNLLIVIAGFVSLFTLAVPVATAQTRSVPIGPLPVAEQQAENKINLSQGTQAYVNTPACSALSSVEDNSISSQLKCNKTIQTLWKVVIGLVDTVVVVALLAIAFATILHINYDTYGVKKALPAIIIGLVMAHFSLLIARYIVDFAQVLTATFYNSAGNSLSACTQLGTNAGDKLACGLSNTIFGGATATLSGSWLNVGGAGLAIVPLVLLFVLIILIPTIIILILAIELYIRFYLLMFLTIVAPAAWLAISWGPIQGMFKKWWGEFIKWTFMGPLVMFYLWLSIKFYSATDVKTATFGTYILSLMMLYLAVMAPKALGGAVGGFISNKVMGGVNKGGSSALKSYNGGLKNGYNSLGNIKPKSWGGETSLRQKSWGGAFGSTPGDLYKGYKKEKTDNDELRQGQVDNELAKMYGGGVINSIGTKYPFNKSTREKAQARKDLSNIRYNNQNNAEREKRRPNVYQNMSPKTLMDNFEKVKASDNKDEMRNFAMAAAGNSHVSGKDYGKVMKEMRLSATEPDPVKGGTRQVSPYDKDFKYQLDNERKKVKASGISDAGVRNEAAQTHFGSRDSVRSAAANGTADDMVGDYSQERILKVQELATQRHNDLVANPTIPDQNEKLTEIGRVLKRIERIEKSGGKMFKINEDLGIKDLSPHETTDAGTAGLVEALKRNEVATQKLGSFANTESTRNLSSLLNQEDKYK